MKRIVLILVLSALASFGAKAQDSLNLSRMDSTYVGKSILSVIGPGADINQTSQVRQALGSYVSSNAGKSIQGYRIRVFYDNSPQARVRSESIAQYLRAQYPETGVYRSFESPNYKVTIGDFRTKEEALRIYNALKGTYPTAYIIKENINFPR
ncbi:MAG: SPOR domain-containing protein [Bacteroidales bacterium]|nr:SPOR domain-containing protein [Bacteroidales bacterium]